MLISSKGRYALRVLVDMAEHQAAGYVPLKEIAQRQEISEKYLESIIKILVKAGILDGLRGKGGGYRMVQTPDQVSVDTILRLTEGSLSPVSCLEEGTAPCGRVSCCRTVRLWHGLDQVIHDYLNRYTIADLMQPEEPGNDYII